MRSFFKRPSWATRGEEDSTADFYRRADQTYADIIAANKDSRENSTKYKSDRSAEDHTGHKRRHPSPEDDRLPREDRIVSGSPESPRNKLKQKQSSRRGRRSSSPADGDSTRTSSKRLSSPLSASEIIVSDTVDRGRSDTTGTATGSSSPSGEYTHDASHLAQNNSPEVRALQESRRSEENLQGGSLSENTHRDMVIQILITSDIKDTKPLIVQRKISQSLKDVRLAWCSRQNIPKELHSAVYLTWKGKRLFDVTTCKSLGIGANLSSPAADDYSQDDERNVRVHMEAVTDNPLILVDKRQGSVDSCEFTRESTQPEEPGQPKSERIVLKCPGLAELEIMALPSMKVSEVISRFREARNISEDQGMYLIFDGDRLEPENSLEYYEIAEDDLVDVIVK
ncbi:ubiquitin-2 like Rad60 SUMO-like-domain-containing protein [Aspergillus ambiguus]|uniref:small ubiquitin-related modifier domain-containing protein n=1 Tax=Aspergillus ambiguus TaxID=176160 RepID=UPI003CCD3857